MVKKTLFEGWSICSGQRWSLCSGEGGLFDRHWAGHFTPALGGHFSRFFQYATGNQKFDEKNNVKFIEVAYLIKKENFTKRNSNFTSGN